MPLISQLRLLRWAVVPAVAALALLALPTVASAQGPEVIGRIEGEAFAARGQVSVAQEGGRGVTTLLSGSEVTVANGHARIVLADGGGEIDICGPAQASLLKSSGAITLALSYGRVHARVSAELPLQVFTAMVTATPVSVGGRPRDAVIGLEASGRMCIYAPHGAVRLENQFSGQRVLVPQLGEVSIPGGQIENLQEATGSCRCEIPVAQKDEALPPRAPETPLRASSPPSLEKKEEGVTFTAVMPPLTFSAEAPAPPPLPRVQMIQLIRDVRVLPVTYRGRVERAARAQKPQAPPAAPAGSSAGPARASSEKVGFGTRVKNFFKRLFGRKT